MRKSEYTPPDSYWAEVQGLHDKIKDKSRDTDSYLAIATGRTRILHRRKTFYANLEQVRWIGERPTTQVIWHNISLPHRNKVWPINYLIAVEYPQALSELPVNPVQEGVHPAVKIDYSLKVKDIYRESGSVPVEQWFGVEHHGSFQSDPNANPTGLTEANCELLLAELRRGAGGEPQIPHLRLV